jgi:alkaline phosphatase
LKYLHDERMASMTGTASERVVLERDRDGYHFMVGGVRGDAETLAELRKRVLAEFAALDDEYQYRAKIESEMTRNAAGNVQLKVDGSDHEQVKAVFTELHSEHDLSRKQHADRDYLANEIKPVTKK